MLRFLRGYALPCIYWGQIGRYAMPELEMPAKTKVGRSATLRKWYRSVAHKLIILQAIRFQPFLEILSSDLNTSSPG